MEGDGTLLCSYHGWRFDGEGACTAIPQVCSPHSRNLLRQGQTQQHCRSALDDACNLFADVLPVSADVCRPMRRRLNAQRVPRRALASSPSQCRCGLHQQVQTG